MTLPPIFEPLPKSPDAALAFFSSTAVAMMPLARSNATAPSRLSASISPVTAPPDARPRYANVVIPCLLLNLDR